MGNCTTKFKQIVIFIFSLLVLLAGFYSNLWNATDQKWFDEFQMDSESLVIGRLAVAEREGMFSQGCLTGRYVKNVPAGKNIYNYQYELFFSGQPINKADFVTYDSQPGGQAFLFSLFNLISPYSNVQNLKLYKFFTSLLSAALLALFLVWVCSEFNFSCAVVTLLLVALSPWLASFGRNLWWSLWSFYVPFVCLLRTLYKEHNTDTFNLSSFRIFILVYIGVVIKCYFTGFEFISTTLLMLLVPFLYYARRNSWDLRLFVSRLAVASFASIAGVISTFCFLAYQISFVKGTYLLGLQHIYDSYLKRSSGNPGDFDDIYRKSLESDPFQVLAMYWDGIAFDLTNIVPGVIWRNFWEIDFGEAILIFLIFSALVFTAKEYSVSLYKRRKQNIALLETFWISILAPLSWFILFKAHSYIHTHMNFIVWYMPFALLGFVLIANVFTALCKDGAGLLLKRRKTVFHSKMV